MSTGAATRARPPTPTVDRRFIRSWILANGAAEALGLGTTFLLGVWLAPRLTGSSGAGAALGTAAAAIAMGVLLEGVLVGAAQARVLRPRRPDIPARPWILASALGAGLAWTVGMVPSTVMALREATPVPDPTAAPSFEPGLAVRLLLAIPLGLVTGPMLGLVQWTVLRRRVKGAGAWLRANAAAWGVGMPVVFAGMELVPWGGPLPLTAAAIYLVCGVAGLAVGAVHGPVLARLTRTDPPAR